MAPRGCPSSPVPDAEEGSGAGGRPRGRTLVLLTLASIALVATTEVGPRVTSEARGRLVLTEQHPEKMLSLTIIVSAETFSAAPPPGLLVVSFQTRSDQVPDASHLPIRTTYPPDFPSTGSGGDDNSCNYGAGEFCSTWEYRRFSLTACGAECRLSIPVAVAWTEPPPGGELALDWYVAATLEYPVDATAPAGAAILVEGLP